METSHPQQSGLLSSPLSLPGGTPASADLLSRRHLHNWPETEQQQFRQAGREQEFCGPRRVIAGPSLESQAREKADPAL